MLEKIGENIRVFRTIKGYSQEWLSDKVGKSQNWLQKVEKGEIDISILNLQELAKCMETSLEHIISFPPNNIFNNCVQSGTFNNCVINDRNLIEKLIETINRIK